VYLGGDNGKVSELCIEGVTTATKIDSTSKTSMMLRYLKNKLTAHPTKMRKVDRSFEH
jgi:hypothetical protein